MNKYIFRILLLILVFGPNLNAQDSPNTLSLNQAIEIALHNSPASLLAKHHFLIGYWSYKIYKASYLPTVNFSSGSLPSYSNRIESYTNDSGKVALRSTNSSIINSSIHLNQNVFFTGGNISLSSNINQFGNYSDNGPDINYSTSPISLNYRQPLSGYNEFKWDKKIEPLRYEEAKKKYLVEKENIVIQTIDNFFNLIEAETNYEMAQLNQFNTDTIYKIAEGRYKMGTITQDELLQTELKKLDSQVSLQQAKVQLEVSRLQLCSFLGLNNITDINPVVPNAPELSELIYEDVLNKAINNNDQILNLKISLIEANKRVAATKKDKGLNADLEISYGLQGNNNSFNYLFDDMSERSEVQVGLRFPIFDWGRGKSSYQIAKSSLEVALVQSRQALIDFEREVFIQVMNFNLLDEQMQIAQKTDTIASIRYELSKHRYIMGNIAIFDFNQAISDKENAKRDYINSLSTYWKSIYEIRKLTLFDFIDEEDISLKEMELIDGF